MTQLKHLDAGAGTDAIVDELRARGGVIIDKLLVNTMNKLSKYAQLPAERKALLAGCYVFLLSTAFFTVSIFNE